MSKPIIPEVINVKPHPNQWSRHGNSLTALQKSNINNHQKALALTYLSMGHKIGKVSKLTGLSRETVRAIKKNDTKVDNSMALQIQKNLKADHLILNNKYSGILHDIHDTPEVRQRLVDNAHIIPVTAVWNRSIEQYCKLTELEAYQHGKPEQAQESDVMAYKDILDGLRAKKKGSG